MGGFRFIRALTTQPIRYHSEAERQTLRTVAMRHGITPECIVGMDRRKHMVQARTDAIHALRALGLSMPSIGLVVRRDHTTVLHHLRNRTPSAGIEKAPAISARGGRGLTMPG